MLHICLILGFVLVREPLADIVNLPGFCGFGASRNQAQVARASKLKLTLVCRRGAVRAAGPDVVLQTLLL
jgi:hypothetical protein